MLGAAARVPQRDARFAGDAATSTSGTRGSTSSSLRRRALGAQARREERASGSSKPSRRRARRDSLRALSKLTARVDGELPHRHATRRCSCRSTSSPEVERAASSQDGSQGSARLPRARCRPTGAAARAATSSSTSPARWSASAASGPGPGSCCCSAATTSDPLFLQVKEAQASVLEAYAGQERAIATPGERVVAGQRLMQAAERHLPRLADVEAADRRPAARLLRAPAARLEGLGRHRRDDARGHGAATARLCGCHAGARPRALAATGSRSPPTSGSGARSTRPSLAFSRRLRRPERARLRGAGRGRRVRAGQRRDGPLDLVLRGLLGGLERVQHLLLHVGGRLGERLRPACRSRAWCGSAR